MDTLSDERYKTFGAPARPDLHLTAGCSWVHRWGGRIEGIRPGDVIRFPPGEKHCHGGTPPRVMTPIALQEQLVTVAYPISLEPSQ